MATVKLQAVEAPEQPEQTPRFAESLKLASYAATGGRKTLQIGHLIKAFGAENVDIISAERGLGTIRSLVDEKQVFTVNGLEDIRKAWAWAKERCGDNPTERWTCVDGGSRVLYWVNHQIFKGGQDALEGLLEHNGQRSALDADIRKYASYVTKDFDLNSQQMWWRTGYEC